MSAQSRHFQSQAVAILAIATAVVGFGLFGTDFQSGSILWTGGLNGVIARIKLILAMAAVGFYFAAMLSVRKIMRQRDEVTGAQIANWPLSLTFAETIDVGLIFLIGILEEPPPADG